MRMRYVTFCLSFLTLALSFGVAAAETNWTVEKGSRVGFIATQGGAPVEGLFERFTATIAFDADDLANSKVVVEIEIASVNSKSRDRDTAIVGPGLFDISKWPTALFKAAAFRKLGPNRYEADGTLTMRGVAKPVTLPFTLETGPHPKAPGQRQALAQGELTVDRLDYGIGQGPWKDVSVVGNAVTIFIDLLAKR